jgi:hypothetical protein
MRRTYIKIEVKLKQKIKQKYILENIESKNMRRTCIKLKKKYNTN